MEAEADCGLVEALLAAVARQDYAAATEQGRAERHDRRIDLPGSALGLTDPDDVDLIPASELRRFLAPELLARITELAAAEAAGDDPSAEAQQAAPADAPKTADR